MNELRVGSRAERSGRGCGPGPETQAEGVVQGWNRESRQYLGAPRSKQGCDWELENFIRDL